MIKWIHALLGRKTSISLTVPLRGAVTLDMVPIPAGEFLMGSPEDEEGRYDDEGPQHRVRLAPFFMARTPITQEQWRALMGTNPSHFEGDQRPVETVSWYDAMEFCSRLSQHTGRHYTLPSEAQWEYACRAGTTTPYAFGDSLSQEQANIAGSETTPVGSYPANAWGLHDMHGNVWEWCLDHWHDSYVGAPDDGSAWAEGDRLGKCCAAALGTTTPGTAARLSATSAARATATTTSVSASVADTRLLRGGSWIDLPWLCRSACRGRNLPVNRNPGGGFRVCCLP